MFENVAVIDKLAELRERDIEDDRGRGTLAAAPLIDGANTFWFFMTSSETAAVGTATPSRRFVFGDSDAHEGIERFIEQ